jgi:hypothetical protein
MGAHTVEIPSDHVAMVTHPAEVAELIEKAAALVELEPRRSRLQP